MTLTELIQAHPDLFYSQSWYEGELFMHVPQQEPHLLSPALIIHAGTVPSSDADLHRAVDWCHAYVKDPANPVWEYCLWCKDVDRWGQRVYLTKQVGAMQIHRYLHLTDRFGVPVQ
jgi:hypothetical protein